MDPMYCTVEQIKQATNVTAPARMDVQIAGQISAASVAIDGDMRRCAGAFWPVTDTRYYDWLDPQYSLTWRLWLGENEMGAAPTQVLSAGVDITSGVLARNGVGDAVPPFTSLETDLSTGATFAAGATYQRAIAVTGLFLATPPVETPGGTLAAVTSSATTAVCSNGSLVGIGSVVHVDNERMVVTGKALADTGLTVQSPGMTASTANNVVPVTSGALFSANETIVIDGEEMLITSIAGNNLLVQRQYVGSPLQAHLAGAEIFAFRQLTLLRGALGTTAASHAANAPINVHVVDSLINRLAMAETLRLLGWERSGYTLVVERGSLLKVGTADELWNLARARHQRKLRIMSDSRFI